MFSYLMDTLQIQHSTGWIKTLRLGNKTETDLPSHPFQDNTGTLRCSLSPHMVHCSSSLPERENEKSVKTVLNGTCHQMLSHIK